MREKGSPISGLLKVLESFYGRQEPSWPTDPYLFLVWWHCGYPASDTACAKGWQSLTREIGVEPDDLLEVSPANLGRALRPGGMVPELRAMRLKEIAARVKDEYAGDLRSALVGPIAQVRKLLKKFPNIADPGADRILLFGSVAPVAAVPSTVRTSSARSAPSAPLRFVGNRRMSITLGVAPFAQNYGEHPFSFQACLRMGMWGSASFQSVRKSW